MANPIAAISRLFKRKPQNALVAELYGRAIGKPLLAHADMGAQILKGYLSSQAIQLNNDGENLEPIHVIHEGVGIIDVSGALVSRPMGWCSPLSYAEIAQSIDTMLADDKVHSIVLRLDSPGGEVSGMLDLSDHIYNARGIKPIIAAVDDVAYSACYGIASACDRIVLSRTSGVGSIGVVSYHVDQSEYNKKQGIKVEYLFAGDRKVDGNPDEPLSDTGREAMQAEINRLYELFVETVARNRDMDADFVRSTQAACYYGQNAIDCGLADSLMTFPQLMASLVDGSFTLPAQSKPKPVEVEVEVDADDTSEAPEQNLPQATRDTGLDNDNQADRSEPSADDTAELSIAATAISDTKLSADDQDEIRSICAAAGLSGVAKAYIKSNTSVEEVRADLMDVQAAGEQEIQTARSSAMVQPDCGLNASTIYKRRKGA